MSFLYKNCYDGIYKSIDVHFTNKCGNKCSFCIDKNASVINNGIPDVSKMISTVIKNWERFDGIHVLGGDPLLFIDELYYFLSELKIRTKLKLYITSSVPYNCVSNYNTFVKILDLVDGFNISAQHYDEALANKIRGTTSLYNRQEFYSKLPYKDKIRINLNLVKGFLDTRETIREALLHYGNSGFNSIKLSEIQHDTSSYISIEKLFDMKLPSAYSGGCQTYVDTKKVFDVEVTSPVLLKRNCFICEDSLSTSILDGVKVITKCIHKKQLIDNNNYMVVYKDGSISRYWLKTNKE